MIGQAILELLIWEKSDFNGINPIHGAFTSFAVVRIAFVQNSKKVIATSRSPDWACEWLIKSWTKYPQWDIIAMAHVHNLQYKCATVSRGTGPLLTNHDCHENSLGWSEINSLTSSEYWLNLTHFQPMGGQAWILWGLWIPTCLQAGIGAAQGTRVSPPLCTRRPTSGSCWHPRTRLLPLICPVTVLLCA